MEKKLKADYNLQYSSFTFHNFLRNDALHGLLVFSRNFLVFSIKYFFFMFFMFLFFKTKKWKPNIFFPFKKIIFKKSYLNQTVSPIQEIYMISTSQILTGVGDEIMSFVCI